MTSSGESLLLYFHSDSSSQKDGFTLTVTLLSPYDLSQGSFSGIPGVYDYNNGSPITVSYTVLNIMGNAVSPSNYDATIDGQNTTTVSTLGDHTLTVTGKEPYFGTLTKTFKVMQALSGEGTQDNPYLINNNGDWEGFATRVNNGETYSGQYVKLNADNVTASMMVGESEEHSFQGTFLGSGTMTNQFAAEGKHVLADVTDHLTITGTHSDKLNIAEGSSLQGSYSYTVRVYGEAPKNLTCSSLAGTTATLTWTDDNAISAGWTVEYSTSADFADGETTSVDVTEKSVTIEGLTLETLYYVRVRATYAPVDFGQGTMVSGQVGDWSSVINIEPTSKLVIGSGTSTSSYLPTNNYYRYSLTQQIYTAEEIGQEGLIKSIDFYKNATTGMKRKLDIYMVNTEKTSFSSGSDWILTNSEGVVKVFSGEQVFDDKTWTTITLDTPFAYDGQ